MNGLIYLVLFGLILVIGLNFQTTLTNLYIFIRSDLFLDSFVSISINYMEPNMNKKLFIKPTEQPTPTITDAVSLELLHDVERLKKRFNELNGTGDGEKEKILDDITSALDIAVHHLLDLMED